MSLEELLSRLGVFSVVLVGMVALWRAYLKVQERAILSLEDANKHSKELLESQGQDFVRAVERMTSDFEQSLRLREERRAEQMTRLTEVLTESANAMRRIGDGVDELKRRGP